MNIISLYWLLGAFVGGVFFADIFREYWVLNGVFFFIALAFIPPKYTKISWKIFGASGLLFLLGCLRLFFSLPENFSPLVDAANKNENIMIEGYIDQYPVQSPEKISFYMRVEMIVNKDTMYRVSADENDRVLVNIYGIHSYSYGDKIWVTGKISRPKNSENFSYARYLERDGVYTYFKNARAGKIFLSSSEQRKISLIQEIWRQIFSVREWFESRVRSQFPMPESEYALGITLGAEKGIPENIIADFNDSGLRHLLALSGFNITILLLIIFWMFSWVSIRWRIAISLLIITIFVGLTGASSSVLRAAVMGGIGMIILHSGREKNILSLLFVTLAIIALWNPFLLVADPGFQLSILAVLGMYFLIPIFQKILPLSKKIPEIFREAFYATISAQIGTLPLTILFFGKISFIAPVANVLVAPLTSFAMLFTVLTAIPFIGVLFMPIAYAVLHLSLSLASFFAGIPGGNIGG